MLQLIYLTLSKQGAFSVSGSTSNPAQAGVTVDTLNKQSPGVKCDWYTPVNTQFIHKGDVRNRETQNIHSKDISMRFFGPKKDYKGIFIP